MKATDQPIEATTQSTTGAPATDRADDPVYPPSALARDEPLGTAEPSPVPGSSHAPGTPPRYRIAIPIYRIAAVLSMNRAPPSPYPPPTKIIDALGKVSVAWIQYKRARKADKDQAAADYAAAYAEASRVTLSVWLSESQQAYVAIGVDGEVYASRPAHWPSVIWPEAVEIWAQVEGLYAIVARYLDDEAKIFLNFELARIQGELLTYVDMDTSLADVAAATARTRSRVESALANLLLGATTRATFRYLRGMVRAS